jgi:hypothetical protein
MLLEIIYMAKAESPQNLFVNRVGNTAFLRWDKVVRDINQDRVKVDSYIVYKTPNPNGLAFDQLATITTLDPFTDADVFYVDYTATGDFLYRVCPVVGTVIGECTNGYGVSGEGEITEPVTGLWDLSLWDSDMWA